MKCPQCSHQHRKKLGLICGKCGRSFVFDGTVMTDGRFAGIIRRTSGNGTYFYTKRQLTSEWRTLVRRRSPLWKMLGVAGTGVGFMAFVLPDIAWLPWVGLGGLVLLSALGIPRPLVPRSGFSSLLEKWAAREPLVRLIEGNALKSPPPDWNEPAMLDVGVEAILVVDEPDLVDFFVLNQAHADHRVLVLSSGGYPSYILPALERVLQAQPEVPVCYLHGTGKTAEELRRQLHLSVPMDRGRHRDLGWNWDEATRSGRVHKAGQAEQDDIAVDWLPPKQLLEGVGRAIATETRLAEAIGFTDDDADAHFG